MNDLRRILLLSANPKGIPKARLDEEMREIEEGLRRAKQRSQFMIQMSPAARYRDLRRVILDYEPHIVHFSGHGEGEEGLVFEDETGRVKPADRHRFKILNDGANRTRLCSFLAFWVGSNVVF